MGEESSEHGQQQSSDAEQGKQADEFKPITSQEEFERTLGKRLERERAKFADYDDLKSKAAKLAEIEERDKSELQRATERAEAAERRATEHERQAKAASIAAETGVPVEMIIGSSEDEMRSSADRLAKWRDEGGRRPPPVKSTRSGATKSSSPADRKEAAAAALRRMSGD